MPPTEITVVLPKAPPPVSCSTAPTRCCGLTIISTGSPQGIVTADPGQDYFDTVTEFFWVKAAGTGKTGWVLVTGGGATADYITDGVVDPVNPPIDPSRTNIYINTAVVPKSIWEWPAGGAAWEQIV